MAKQTEGRLDQEAHATGGDRGRFSKATGGTRTKGSCTGQILKEVHLVRKALAKNRPPCPNSGKGDEKHAKGPS